MVNSDEIVCDEIIVRYFEPGHTFVAADSFHHRVQLSMQRMGNKLYDFEDFSGCENRNIQHRSSANGPQYHFFQWPDYSSQYKLSRVIPRPYLHDVVEVIFTRGSTSVKYKNDFCSNEYIELNFLTAALIQSGSLPKPKKRDRFTGITAEKRQNILKILGGCSKKNPLKFWENLPES